MFRRTTAGSAPIIMPLLLEPAVAKPSVVVAGELARSGCAKAELVLSKSSNPEPLLLVPERAALRRRFVGLTKFSCCDLLLDRSILLWSASSTNRAIASWVTSGSTTATTVRTSFVHGSAQHKPMAVYEPVTTSAVHLFLSLRNAEPPSASAS